MAAFDLGKFRDVPARLQALAAPQTSRFRGASHPHESGADHARKHHHDHDHRARRLPPLDAARAEGARAEVQRRADIGEAFKPFARFEGAAEAEAACLNDATCTVADANKRILAMMAKGATSAAGRTSVETVEDQRDKIVAAGVQVLMARAGSAGRDGKRVVADASNPFRGQTLLEMARASLVRAGIRTDGMDKMQIVAAAFTQSTSDFPILLENTMHKALQSAYAVAPDTWRRFAAEGSVSDFRAHNRYRVGSLSNLDAKTELGEFKNKVIPDGEKSSITAATKGNIINLSREAIVNDDLSAFVGLASALGRAAKRTVEVDVYATPGAEQRPGPDAERRLHAVPRQPQQHHHRRGHLHAGHRRRPRGDEVAAGRRRQRLPGPDACRAAGAGGPGRHRARHQRVAVRPGRLEQAAEAQHREGHLQRHRGHAAPDGHAPLPVRQPERGPGAGGRVPGRQQRAVPRIRAGFDVDGSRWKVRLDYGVAGIDYRGAVTNAGPKPSA